MSTKQKPLPNELELPQCGVDTHAHLDLPQFKADLPAVLERSRDSGLRYLVNVFLGPEAYLAGKSLFDSHPEVFFALGQHPHEAEQLDIEALSRLEEYISRDARIRAMGEIGLDFFRLRSSEERQIRAFRDQLRLARDYDWPVVIHSREAAQRTLEILRDMGFAERPVLWHCFAGDGRLAREVAAMGWMVSVPGTLTYTKASDLRLAVQELPLSRIVLETDCPFLSPEPYRGQRNEPAFTVFTARALAEAKGLAVEDVWKRTGDNAISFFSLQRPAEGGSTDGPEARGQE